MDLNRFSESRGGVNFKVLKTKNGGLDRRKKFRLVKLVTGSLKRYVGFQR